MALVGTVSGSNGTSNTAITGTLVVANTNTNFPSIPSDALLFVSGNLSSNTSMAVFGGRVVVSGTLTGSSDIIAGGTLISINSSGDEGGEIRLEKPVTNTFISGSGITIDVYQNKLRIFETGTPFKGGFWNIGDFASGVGTNLRTAGGSQYSYRSVSADDTMSSTDAIIGCNHSAAITIKLPLASDCGAGQFFIIKDEAGQAATYNIVVSKSFGSSDTIDGKDAYTLTAVSSSITIYRGGTGKFFIT
jgi:hypothetical protein